MANEIIPLTRVLGYLVTGDLGDFTFYTNRRGRIVFYSKAPPLSPTSPAQRVQRTRMQQAGAAWQNMTPGQRAKWRQAAARCNMPINGPALAAAWIMKPGAWIETVARQSNVQLPPSP